MQSGTEKFYKHFELQKCCGLENINQFYILFCPHNKLVQPIIIIIIILVLTGYPWDSIFSGKNYGAMERWLYLPHTGDDTLDKYLLYSTYRQCVPPP